MTHYTRLRLERAKFHGKALANLWNSIPPGDFFGVRAKADQHGFGKVLIVGVKPVPDEFSLLLGELLYQLRSALDACVYQATIYATGKNPPADENKLEFPLTFDASEFPNLAKRRISALPQNVQDGVERVQPYNTPTLPPEEMVENLNRSLGILNDLARKDRHRKLHVVGAWPIKNLPEFALPEGVVLESVDLMDAALLEEGSELATFQLKGYVFGMDVKVNPNLVTQIGLNEPPPPCHASDTFDRRLVEMTHAVNSVISTFEQYF